MKPRTIVFSVIAIIVIGAGISIYLLRNRGGTYRQPDTESPFDHTHSAFDHVLRAHVKDGGQVDYAAIKNDPVDLDTFLDRSAAVRKTTYEKWTDDQKLAFLINLYNAATMRLVIDHYPVASIKDIGNTVVTAWHQPVVRLFGEFKSLNHVEHELIRIDFDEPRIHFALVCAAKSCPPLRAESFVADRLDAQLEDQGTVFLNDTTKNKIDPASRTASLSKIFDWYGDDFTGDGRPFFPALAGWFPPADQSTISSKNLKIRFLDYDWALNGLDD